TAGGAGGRALGRGSCRGRARRVERARAGVRGAAARRRRHAADSRSARRRDSSDRQRRRGRGAWMKLGKLTLPELAAMKERGEKIVMVTAYDAPGARLAEQAGIDILLVGDTAGMVVLGHEGTVPVTMDEMLFLTRTVARTVQRPLVVGDMPFGSYHVSDEDAVRNAIRFVKEAGADVVKLEGAGPSLSRVRAIVSAGIGVMGHVGVTPQAGRDFGGLQTQGPSGAEAGPPAA